MCVAVAMKLPRDKNTGLPTKDAKWRLAKIRDRIYDAHYKVKRYTVNEHGAAQLFLVDGETDWTEGISVREDGFYLSMVNSALLNYSDKKDGKDGGQQTVAANGRIIRKALKSKSIDDAAQIIKDNKFDGCTLLTDGDRLIVIESSLPTDVMEKYKDKLKPGKRFEDIVPVEEYKFKVKEIKDDYLVVRTNRGVLDSSFGYQKDGTDGDKSYHSSVKRRKYTIKALEKSAFEPIDLIVNLSKLGKKEIDKDPFYRPIRLKGEAEVAKDDVDVYTTTIIQTDPSGTMIVKPIECTFDIKNMNNLIDDKYKAHMVILPHKFRMFESFKQFAKLI